MNNNNYYKQQKSTLQEQYSEWRDKNKQYQNMNDDEVYRMLQQKESPNGRRARNQVISASAAMGV